MTSSLTAQAQAQQSSVSVSEQQGRDQSHSSQTSEASADASSELAYNAACFVSQVVGDIVSASHFPPALGEVVHETCAALLEKNPQLDLSRLVDAVAASWCILPSSESPDDDTDFYNYFIAHRALRFTLSYAAKPLHGNFTSFMLVPPVVAQNNIFYNCSLDENLVPNMDIHTTALPAVSIEIEYQHSFGDEPPQAAFKTVSEHEESKIGTCEGIFRRSNNNDDFDSAANRMSNSQAGVLFAAIEKHRLRNIPPVVVTSDNRMKLRLVLMMLIDKQQRIVPPLSLFDKMFLLRVLDDEIHFAPTQKKERERLYEKMSRLDDGVLIDKVVDFLCVVDDKNSNTSINDDITLADSDDFASTLQQFYLACKEKVPLFYELLHYSLFSRREMPVLTLATHESLRLHRKLYFGGDTNEFKTYFPEFEFERDSRGLPRSVQWKSK